MATGKNIFSSGGLRPSDRGGPPRLLKIWDCILQFALVLWVVRVPLLATALGLLILGDAPQAQDLFVEFARISFFWMFYFMFVLIAVWAMPTHYAARLLLDTDTRLRRRLATEKELKQKRRAGQALTAEELKQAACLESSAVWVPRLLGLLTFVAVLIAILRSHLNLPDLEQKEVIAAVNRALIEVALLVVVGAAAFLYYVVNRPRNAEVPILGRVKHVNSKLAFFWRKFSPGLPDVRGSDDEASRDLGRPNSFGNFRDFPRHFLVRRRYRRPPISARYGCSVHSRRLASVLVVSFRSWPAMAGAPYLRPCRRGVGACGSAG